MIIDNKAQLTTVAKRVQTRLSKQGIKASLGKIKPICENMIADINNPLPDEMELVIQHFIDTNTAIAMVNVSSVPVLESEQEQETETEETHPAPLANTTHTQSQMITATANTMGIVLNAGEIAEIATNLNDSTDSFESEIDAIRSAILAYVRHKSLIAQSKINQMVDDVRRVVSEENRANSMLLSNGLVSINNDIQQAQQDFKSNVSKALTAFAIPAVKAG
jgi:hypothetical protein